MKLRQKLRGLFRKERTETELSDELRAHLEMLTQHNLARGMAPVEARRAALRDFGGLEQIKERCRDERGRGFIWCEHLAQDLRYATRSLRKSPGFAAVVVLSLALGIGANTTVFSLLNDLLLRDLPVRNPGELILFRYYGNEGGWIAGATEGNGGKDVATGRSWHGSFSREMFRRFESHHPGLVEVFAFAPLSQAGILIDGEPEVVVSGQLVSGNYHAALGVSAMIGRVLAPDDDRASAEPVAVISHRYWQNRFAGNPDVLGKTILINQVPTTIVGVTPPGFAGTMQVGQSPDLTVALGLFSRFHPGQPEKLESWFWWLHIMGRLAPGATAAQARDGLEADFEDAAREAWRARPRPPGAVVEKMPGKPTLATEPGGRGENDRRRDYGKSLGLAMGLVSLVLLAACANVANLLIARGANRRREIAVRLALGAGRGRIVRQLLVESSMLALAGAALGTFLAVWGRDLLLRLRPFGTATALDLPLDLRVLGFTMIATGATALLSGLAPALRATRVDVSREFQGGPRPLVGARSRLSRALMALQIALSVVLLVTTGLFVRTLHNLRRVDAGFNREGLILFRIEAAAASQQPAQSAALHARLRERMEKIPGVNAVTYSDIELVSGRRMGRLLTLLDSPARTGEQVGAYFLTVAPNFFPAMQMPLLLGRGFDERDDAAAPKVAVVNQTFARQFFGDENAIGRHFAWVGDLGRTTAIEIVGIARDAKYTDLRDAPNATVYTPLRQVAASGPGDGVANFAVRVSGDPGVYFPLLRLAAREVAPALPLRNLRTQEEQIDRLNAQPILLSRLSGCFGLLALMLACVGLYGLMSYIVVRRTGEIGLRMALGAMPSGILRRVIGESLGLVGIGLVAGVGAAVAVTRLMTAMLYELSPMDPLTYGAVALGLIVVGSLAALVPAWRAARVDPMTALRVE